MKVENLRGRYTPAFTIVELIVVVTVVAILVGVTVVGYGAWRTGINASTVKSDLIAAATAMESGRNDTTGFPTTVPSSFSPSQNVVITVASASMNTFCLNGRYAPSPSIQYYTDEKIKTDEPKSGTCSSRVAANVPNLVTNVTYENISSSQIELRWTLASPNYASSYELQCAQDPAFILEAVNATVPDGTATVGSVAGVEAGVTHYCRVRAVNANGKSDWSNSPGNGSALAATCAETNQYGTFPDCYNYDSLATGTSISGYWSTPPSGYLLENGAAVSRTTYSDLFDLIGTTYGMGDGFSTFNLPDSRGRATVNISAADTEFDTIGEKYGEKNHALTVDEMPSHTHSQYITANSGGSAVRNDYASDGASQPYPQNVNTNSAGSGTAYSVIQPSIAKRYAIKFRPSTGTASTLPAGATLQGYWSSAPANYLNENGAAVSRTTYSSLFTAIGTTYGAGNGSSTFTLPNSQGRVGVAMNSGDSDFGALGQTSGEKRHTLTIAEMVPHTHALNITALTGGGAIRNDYVSDSSGQVYDQGQQTGNTGNGQPHNVIQPSIVKRSTVKSSAASGTTADAGIKPGTSIEGWWSTVPAGYLLEDGSAVSRTTYSALFAAIGTAHGAGNGSTTFNLPDSRGRVGVHLNTSDTEFNTIGKKFGAKTHIMSLAELPIHSHAQYVTANSGCCGVRRDYNADSSGRTFAQGIQTSSTGSGAAFNKLQPSITKMTVIKF